MITDDQILSEVKARLKHGDRTQIADLLSLSKPYISQILAGKVSITQDFLHAYKQVVEAREKRESEELQNLKTIIE